MNKYTLVIITSILIANTSSESLFFDHGVDLPTNRPLNIAHQGGTGIYPEHTVAGYANSITEGADVIECDMCITRDLHVVCAHESWLNSSTNIQAVFPETRLNTYFLISKGNITDYFTVDFTLDEVKQVQRRQRQSYRNPKYDDMFPIATLQECIEVAKSTNRSVGLHLETKESNWVNSLDIIRDANTTFEDIILDVLTDYNYTMSTDPCFIQSFSRLSLEYFRPRTQLPLVMFINEFMDTSDEALEEYAQFAYGIGPTKSLLVCTDDDNRIIERTDLVERAHYFGLRVHSFTMRNEDRHLAWDYGQDPYQEYQDYLDMEADGLFTDFPGTYFEFLRRAYECT